MTEDFDDSLESFERFDRFASLFQGGRRADIGALLVENGEKGERGERGSCCIVALAPILCASALPKLSLGDIGSPCDFSFKVPFVLLGLLGLLALLALLELFLLLASSSFCGSR